MLLYRIQGRSEEEADTLASAELSPVPERCAVAVARDASGVVLPAVGPQCAAATRPPGSQVEGPRLRDCLHALLDHWVDRVGPSPKPLRPNIVFILMDDQR